MFASRADEAGRSDWHGDLDLRMTTWITHALYAITDRVVRFAEASPVGRRTVLPRTGHRDPVEIEASLGAFDRISKAMSLHHVGSVLELYSLGISVQKRILPDFFVRRMKGVWQATRPGPIL